jgi:hypothetical protein
LDDLDCYAFAVKPITMAKDQRYFSGIVWVDDVDVQVVKTYGRAVGIVAKGHVYPKFETYRQKVDGKYWFPVYTIAEDTFHFEDGNKAYIKQVIKYEKYKQFKAESRIIDATEEVPSPSAPQSPPPPTVPGLPPPPTR